MQVISRGGRRRSPSNEVRARKYFSAVAHRHIHHGTGHKSEGYAVHSGAAGTATRNGGCRSPRIAIGARQDRAVRAERDEHTARGYYRTEVADTVRDRRRLSPCSHARRTGAGVVEVAREDGGSWRCSWSRVAHGYDPVEDRVISEPV